MSAAEAPDAQDPEEAGTCPEDVPSLKEIEQLLSTGRPSCNHVDEVWPNLFLGDLVTAHNRFVLWKMGVTHVLNAAHGTAYSHGGQDFYGATIDYYGVPAHDLPSFDISQFFFSAAQFIHNALNTPGDSFFTKLRKTNVRSIANVPFMSFNRWAARSKTTLQSLNITHILNAADGPYSINTGAKYYADLQIEYCGVEAFDDPSFDLSTFFYDAANFIGKALNSPGGKVFVHCAMGVSRSATLVLAFLMIHENMTLVDALKAVSAHRNICPNSGFLSQLRDLDIKLNEERKGTRASATKGLYVARDKAQLSRMGISHIVNAAAGRFRINTGPKFYNDLPVDYYGIEAEDNPNFDLSIHFYPVAHYIRAALNSPRGLRLGNLDFHPFLLQHMLFAIEVIIGSAPEKGKVLVHCAMGISRSATLVLAFLMICEGLSLTAAIQTVRSHRGICPNSGFLQQLRELDLQLGRGKGRGAEAC
ncbi:hypothetical protein TURU_101660 [Turdus rufiventris]|nr:hypothetical protein TURU_101660 [Turdus rufiventris]